MYAADDAQLPHVTSRPRPWLWRWTVGTVRVPGPGAVVAAGRDNGADLVHPGYGFLSEDAGFAAACADAGLTFVGPDPQILNTFGDKVSARTAAVDAGVPVLAATESGIDEAAAIKFLAGCPDGIMIKAVAGGGGRGMRPVAHADEVSRVFRMCADEARVAFGNGDLFAEELLADARHIEVQVVAAPGTGGATVALAIGDRDRSVQRRRQKLIEVAPAQWLCRRSASRAALRRRRSVRPQRLLRPGHRRIPRRR